MFGVATIVSKDRVNELLNIKQYLLSLGIPIEWSIVINELGSDTNQFKYEEAETLDNLTIKYTIARLKDLDFSLLKNTALNQIKSDWVLILDSDDYIATSPNELISDIELINSVPNTIEAFNVFVASPIILENEATLQTSKQVRIVRNYIRFKNLVHEQPIVSSNVLDTTILINHSGYREHNVKNMIPKIQRNINLLIKNLNYDIDNGYLHIMLAEAYKDLQKNNLLGTIKEGVIV